MSATAASRRRLRWWWAPAGLATAHGAPILVGLAVTVALGLHHRTTWTWLAGTTLLQACLVLTAWLFARRAAPSRPWRVLFVCPTNARHAVGWVALGWVTTIVLSAMYWSGVDPHLPRTHHTGVPHPASSGAVAAILVSAIVLAPIAEELFYRGLFFNALRRKLPIGLAVAVTAVVFGLAHMIGGDPLVTIPPRVIFGVVACLLVIRTGSLLPGMALHAWNNAFATAPSPTGLGIVVIVGLLSAAVALLAPWRRWQRRSESAPRRAGPQPA